VQLGAPLLAAAVLGLAVAIGRICSRVRRRAAFELGLLAGIVAGIGWALVETYLLSPGNLVAPLFWIILAVALAAPTRVEQ
jgi:hypothetical protein